MDKVLSILNVMHILDDLHLETVNIKRIPIPIVHISPINTYYLGQVHHQIMYFGLLYTRVIIKKKRKILIAEKTVTL